MPAGQKLLLAILGELRVMWSTELLPLYRALPVKYSYSSKIFSLGKTTYHKNGKELIYGKNNTVLKHSGDSS